MPELSIHPYQPYIPAEATQLIIGSIPPPRFCKKISFLEKEDVNFYYGSRDNGFWSLIGQVFGMEFSFENSDHAVQERKDLLEKIHIGITDIVASCYHINDSASDKDLEILQYKNLSLLLKENPSIKNLIYTSEFIKSLVNKAEYTYHRNDNNDKRNPRVEINDTLYNVHILYSPSPQALINLGKNGQDKRLQQYINVFKNKR